MTKRLRVLAYSCNGTGMGHITRTMAISRRIKTLAQAANIDPQIFLLTSSEGCSVAHREGFVSFKIPSPNAIKSTLPSFTNEYRNSKNDFKGIGQRLSLAIMEEINPDILIIDNSTSGYLREFTVSDILKRTSTSVFIYRERKKEKINAGFLEYMPDYDVIIAPHKNTTNLIVPNGLEDRLHAVGSIMIRDKTEILDKYRVHHTYNMESNKLNLYATAGGGGDKKHNGTLYKIIENLSSDSVDIYAGLGTLHRGEIPTFDRKAKPISHYPMVELFNGFDLAISAAGYNTVNELLHTGVPTILYPQARNVDNQEKRVRDLNKLGAVIGLEDLSEENLKIAFEELNSPERREELKSKAMETVPNNGAWTAAYKILENELSDTQLTRIKDIYSEKLVL